MDFLLLFEGRPISSSILSSGKKTIFPKVKLKIKISSSLEKP